MEKLKFLNAKKIIHRNGSIVVFEKSNKIKFSFKRVFVVNSDQNQIRGKHAHKKCIQVLSCLNGKIKIYCETKEGRRNYFILDKPEKFLIIPKMTWCVQKYQKKNSILMVICSDKFQEKDYIRNYSSFLKLSKK